MPPLLRILLRKRTARRLLQQQQQQHQTSLMLSSAPSSSSLSSSATAYAKHPECPVAAAAALAFLCFHLPHAAVVTARHAARLAGSEVGPRADWTMQVSLYCQDKYFLYVRDTRICSPHFETS